ncbi:hypothetical protein [Marinivivus vitaminiproducens]|uniref:hypothetical protein n=1 Tax=Marinivivus vitaminiproducens TaxID=3035935 RepID=UPI00279F35AD|nr:hypothetical protein P4R82_11735 [Geminicoccaceae bacterium SCSIO 64248]
MLINYLLFLLVVVVFGGDIVASIEGAGLMPAVLPVVAALAVAAVLGRVPLAWLAGDRSRPAAALAVWCVDHLLVLGAMTAVVVLARIVPLP